jgi:hypothetical protein
VLFVSHLSFLQISPRYVGGLVELVTDCWSTEGEK